MSKTPTKPQGFAEWLSEGLSKPGKSNTDLARILGINQSRVSEMRAGRRNPKASELRPISDYLGSLPPELLPVASTNHRIRIEGEVQAQTEKRFSDVAEVKGLVTKLEAMIDDLVDLDNHLAWLVEASAKGPQPISPQPLPAKWRSLSHKRTQNHPTD